MRMGYFSWMTCDTNTSISNKSSTRGAFPVYVLVPEEYGGECIEEDDYEGYGVFGGHDIYDLVVDWNLPYINEAFLTSTYCMKGEEEDGYFMRIAKDFFHLTPEEMKEKHGDEYKRNVGIILACYDEDNEKLRYPIKIATRPRDYDDCRPSPSCPDQGYFYDDDDDDDEWGYRGDYEDEEDEEDE